MRPARLLVAGLLAVLAGALLTAPPAGAHAFLQSTVPSRGATVAAQPKLVVFRFNEAVEGSFGAVRVFDAKGNRVESGTVQRPGGQRTVAIGLKSGLPQGTYTATYRVISADSHPVSGGFVFSIGHAGPAPGQTVAELAGRAGGGPATEVAFGIVRGLGYLAIALAAGGLLFLAAVWLPALRATADGGVRWRGASERFAHRMRAVLFIAVLLGAASSALEIVLQGATAAGTSFWSALDATVVREVLHTRFGTIWGLRLIAWLALGAVLGAAWARSRVPALEPAALGAAGHAAPRLRPAVLAAAAVPVAFLIVSPALAGHASTQSPRGLLVPLDIVHVAAMSAWLGGLVALVAVLPAATRRLEPHDRSRLLAATLLRFSPLALAAVGALLATGLVQAYVHVRSADNLLHTAFGRAVLIKASLLVTLIVLGAWNRRRGLPALQRIAAEGAPPGPAGRAMRRSLRAEVGLIVVVLGVTAALVSYAPSTARSPGPYSVSQRLGPLELEMTVDPARVGSNQVHLYLFRAKDGTQFRGTKELTVRLSQPDKAIGPIPVRPEVSGPGHYTVQGATFGVAGTWRVTVTDRVSDFDEYQTTVKVSIR